MDNIKLSNLLFPNITETPADIEAKYPPRALPDGAKVTRIAPSPTGYIHFGNLFPAVISERLAHQSGGVFYLRIEDTDLKRRVKGAEELILSSFSYYGLEFDEGLTADENFKGDYAPYRQSDRKDIYQVYAKDMVARGLAYPCFCTEEELAAIREEQQTQKQNPGYYGKWAKYRNADIETIEKKLAEGNGFVLRFKNPAAFPEKFKFADLIKGEVTLTADKTDIVLLKTNGIPTYAFAHAIDDTLMGTTHVIRGEDWLSSLPIHLALFKALDKKPPKYAHLSQLLKSDGKSKKKMSKRDLGAGLDYYRKEGFPRESVIEYVMTLLNSNYEEWRTANKDKKYTDFPFSLKKMSQSGCLFDLNKLIDISKNVISRMTAEELYNEICDYAKDYDAELAEMLSEKEKALKILSIGRGGNKPRKDIAKYSEAKDYMSFFYDKFFTPAQKFPEGFNKEDIKAALTEFGKSFYISDEQNVWFDKIKDIARNLGFAADMKEYKANPENFKGSVADISSFIRVAVTGKESSPDMYSVMQIMGERRILERIKNACYLM
jgi:glutamyl-tRNA synthetase